MAKKTAFLFLLGIVLLTLWGCQSNGDFTSGDFQYTIIDNHARITAYTGSEETLTLPVALDGHPITALQGDFLSTDSFASVVTLAIPEGYTVIGFYTFNQCPNLTTVYLPGTLERINDYAFYACPSLTRLALPQKLVSIGSLAFRDSALESIRIPDSVTWFGDNPFVGCKRLKEIIISDRQPELSWADGVLLNHTGNKLLVYPSYREDVAYTVPESVTVLGNYAFAETALQTVALPKALRAIPPGLFSGCTALQTLEIPSGVTDIGYSAFSGCTALRSVTLPASIERINESAFEGCTSLTLLLPADSEAERFAKEQHLAYTLTTRPASLAQASATASPRATSTPAKQTLEPSATPSPKTASTSADSRDEDGLPIPAQGEHLYFGDAEVSQAAQLTVAFILSADGTEIHSLTIVVRDLALHLEYGNTVTRITGGTVTEKVYGIFPADKGPIDLPLGKTQITDLSITGNTATCTLAYAYRYNNRGSGVPSTDVPFDVSTVSLTRR